MIEHTATTRTGTAYSIAGDRNAECVVLIHGIGLNQSIWTAYTPLWAQRYRVIRYDLPGHGLTPSCERTLNLDVLAAQLVQLLDELAITRAVLVGFSLGGMINRYFAMRYPQRCLGLVVLNSPHTRTPEAQRLVEERLQQTASEGPEATLDTSLARWLTPNFLSQETKAVRRIRKDFLQVDSASLTACRYILAYGVIELVRHQTPIRSPTLIMTCEHDSGSTPEMALAIARDIPGSEAVIVPGLQHLGLIEQPQLFIEPIEQFLLDTLSN
ncbi:MAG: alpha/beta fold hydrolase [Pseudomonadota bacterium]